MAAPPSNPYPYGVPPGPPDPYATYPPAPSYAPPGPPMGSASWGPPPPGPPPGYGAPPPPGPPPPAPRGRRKRLILVVVVIIAVIAFLVFALAVPLAKGSASGSVRLQPNGDGYGFGWQEINTSAGGTVAVTWSLSNHAAEGALVVIPGTCTTILGCGDAVGNGTACASPAASTENLVGATSGTCTFTGGAGTYTVLGVEISGYSSGDQVNYTYSITGPLL